MFVCGFDIKVNSQCTVEVHYFHIMERDFIVGNGTGKLDSRM